MVLISSGTDSKYRQTWQASPVPHLHPLNVYQNTVLSHIVMSVWNCPMALCTSHAGCTLRAQAAFTV